MCIYIYISGSELMPITLKDGDSNGDLNRNRDCVGVYRVYILGSGGDKMFLKLSLLTYLGLV